MAKASVTNHDFTHGMLNESMAARDDLTIYNKCAKLINNMVVVPGGSVRSRFGTQLLLDHNNDITSVSGPIDDHYLIPFSTSKGSFLFILSTEQGDGLLVNVFRIDFEDEDVPTNFYNITSTSTGLDLFTSTSGIMNKSYSLAQAQDTMYVCITGQKPLIITSVSDTEIKVLDLTFKHPPTYDIKRNYDAPVHFEIVGNLTVGSNSVLHAFSDACTTPFSMFDDDYIGGTFVGLGPLGATAIGRAFITAVGVPAGSGTMSTCTINIVAEFDTSYNTCVSGDNCVLTENAVTATNGYPNAVSIYQDRLVLAGTDTLPHSVWFSKIGEYTNFDLGLAAPDDGINFVLSSQDDFSRIQKMVSTKSLQIFSSKAEYATPAWGSDGTQADNISIREQTSSGSVNVQPVVIDNVTIFNKRGGKAMMAFVSSEDAQTYKSLNLTISIDEIMEECDRMVVYTENRLFDGNFLLCRPKNNASLGENRMIIYQSLTEQNVSAWSKADFQVSTSDFCLLNGAVILLMEGQYLAYLNWDECLDMYSTVEKAVGDVYRVPWMGNSGETSGFASMLALGVRNYLGDRPVVSHEVDATGLPDHAMVGYKFNQTLETLPVHFTTQMGDNLFKRKRIVRSWVNFYESGPFQINGRFVNDWSFPITFSGPYAVDSGTKRVQVMYGWKPAQTMVISSDIPVKFQIRGIQVETTI